MDTYLVDKLETIADSLSSIAQSLQIIAQGSEIAYGRLFDSKAQLEAHSKEVRAGELVLGNVAAAASMQIQAMNQAVQAQRQQIGMLLQGATNSHKIKR